MRKILWGLLAAFVLSGCGQKIPQTPEDIRDFGDMLAFIGDTAETDVTGISLDISSETQVPAPVLLSETDTARLLEILENIQFTAEKNILPRYGGSDYVVLFHLSGGETVYIIAEADSLTFWKKSRNAEGVWESAEYCLIPEAPAGTQAVLDAVLQIWEESTHHSQTGITPEQ